MVTVGIIEDDKIVRESLQEFLNAEAEFLCELSADSVESFLSRLTRDTLPDVILMDIGLPGMSGISGIKLIKERYPAVEIIMLTVYSETHKIFQSLCSGASGYLLKNTPFDDIKLAIETVNDGGSSMSPEIARKVIEYFQPEKQTKPKSPLTRREKEVVMGVVDGLSYKMIAGRMNISLQTVRVHIRNIYKKLHVHTKAEVITKSLRGEI
jgi:DNA-binding NarL/FixJ family response regulator